MVFAPAGCILRITDVGNLFLADLGKRQIRRVVPARAGATFRVASKLEVFAEPPGRDRGRADGLALCIGDWQHADTKEAAAVGRSLRLNYIGKSHAQAKPRWYLDVASGRLCRAGLDELLSYPARSVRGPTRGTRRRVMARFLEQNRPS